MPRPRSLAISSPPCAEYGREPHRAVRWRGRWRRGWGRRPRRLGRKRRGAVVDRALLTGGADEDRFTRRRRHGGARSAGIFARGHTLEVVADAPFGLFRRDLHTFDERRVLGFTAMRLHVAVAIG